MVISYWGAWKDNFCIAIYEEVAGISRYSPCVVCFVAAKDDERAGNYSIDMICWNDPRGVGMYLQRRKKPVLKRYCAYRKTKSALFTRFNAARLLCFASLT